MDQGLSYDAKCIYDLAKEKGIDVYISYRTKRKIKWDCKFIQVKDIANQISCDDIIFCFEVFPEKELLNISSKTSNIYLMINYEYYESKKIRLYSFFKTIYVKSRVAYKGCLDDGLKNIKYLQWILSDFSISDERLIQKDEKVRILFNGGTGGYLDRRNLESVVKLIENYKESDVFFTIKLNSKLRRWTKRIYKLNFKNLSNDSRVEIITNTFDRTEYKRFIKSYDINLAPSKFEGYGLTLLESLYSRVPTITFDASPMNEIIKHNENGLCIPCFKIDKINNQPIYQVEEKVFLDNFTLLVKNKELINQFKKNSSLYLANMIKTFKNEIKCLLA